ncbi:hypothetical protein [Methanolobus sp.]|jgi:hypothetical protein|nr:hypothetical protein [Methanolobus sp.]
MVVKNKEVEKWNAQNATIENIFLYIPNVQEYQEGQESEPLIIVDIRK